VRELDALLRQLQEQGLVATARAAATALHDRPGLLASGEPYPVPGSAGGDLRVPNLAKPIVLDGRTEDWDELDVPMHYEGASVTADGSPFALRYSIGRHAAAVYVVLEVQDTRVVMRDAGRPEAACDHLQLAVVTPDDELLRFAVDARSDGPVQAWLLGEDGTRTPDNRIAGGCPGR
jgi:hypothetical protein